MIVSDTTNVNTGVKSGVVRLLQNCFKEKHLSPPQYIGCPHHVLDLILKHVMNELLSGKSTSPNISYDIFTELIMNYENLKQNYKQNEEKLTLRSIKWRDDMQFLYELGQYFKYYEVSNKFPYIKFRVLPALSNARWNSRAILAILTFILIPEHRIQLLPICQFICSAWYDVWFSDHRFHNNDFEILEKSVKQFGTAHKCFLKHWVKEDSAILNLKRSNICAERAIKVIQEIYPFCKSEYSLNLKFISNNIKMN